jgi:hypothetical protein
MNQKSIRQIVVAIIAAAACAGVAHAQSSDALLNKLVSKGLLTKQEADDLKKETDANFDKAYRTKTAMPDWVTQLKIYGDVRGRYDKVYFDNDNSGLPNTERNRFRYRLRVGMTATMKDDFEAGFRLMSGDAVGTFGGNSLSGNSTMQDNGSKKNVYVDLAYGKYTPLHHGPWTGGVTIGKMENPFSTSDMLWDADYTPEGGALQIGYKINDQHALKVVGAVFVLDELNQGANASHDPVLWGAQARWDAKWTKQLNSSIGVAYYIIQGEENLGNAAVENNNFGNTRNAAGNLVYDYKPVVADASVTYSLPKFPIYPGEFPIKLWGEFINNPGVSDENEGYTVGITFGKSGKKGTWEVGYRYERLESDAWYEEFVNDDFGAFAQAAQSNSGLGNGYRSGTNVKGHIIKAGYSPSDSFTMSLTYYLTELINPIPSGSESGTGRIFLDATWKF